jgi:hypothetical protein
MNISNARELSVLNLEAYPISLFDPGLHAVTETEVDIDNACIRSHHPSMTGVHAKLSLQRNVVFQYAILSEQQMRGDRRLASQQTIAIFL